MRYKILSNIEIRTENAAKPASQPSRFLLELVHSLPNVDASFDYGCGKLRYQAAIGAKTDTLAIVDSEIQLCRVQSLLGSVNSIRNIYKKSNQVRAYSDVEFKNLDMRFDRGFCINVLSAIPSYARRREVLSVIHRKLQRGGQCLFVVQYNNSDFTRMRKMPNARPWLDGFLIKSLRGYSFYGLIPPIRLQAALKRAGFQIREIVLNEGSAYVWAATN